MRKLVLASAFVLAPVFALAQQTGTIAPEVAPNAPVLESPAAPQTEAPALSGEVASDVTPEIPGDIATESPAEVPGDTVTDETLIIPEAAEPVVVAADPEKPFLPTSREQLLEMAQTLSGTAMKFLREGGPAIWAIAALSVITLALILWKIWRLALIGAWSRGKAGRAVLAFENGDYDKALDTVRGRSGIRSKVIAAALRSVDRLPEEHAREETTRVARREIAAAGGGLRALELISTIAPLLGLLGTVLGMIAAFQALQQAGSRADPALLAGGIWEALLTTAAGMAVAIPASAALTWFEAVIDRIRRDVEDGASRIFIARQPQNLAIAAE